MKQLTQVFMNYMCDALTTGILQLCVSLMCTSFAVLSFCGWNELNNTGYLVYEVLTAKLRCCTNSDISIEKNIRIVQKHCCTCDI